MTLRSHIRLSIKDSATCPNHPLNVSGKTRPCLSSTPCRISGIQEVGSEAPASRLGRLKRGNSRNEFTRVVLEMRPTREICRRQQWHKEGCAILKRTHWVSTLRVSTAKKPLIASRGLRARSEAAVSEFPGNNIVVLINHHVSHDHRHLRMLPIISRCVSRSRWPSLRLPMLRRSPTTSLALPK